MLEYCDGCDMLNFDGAVNRYDVHRARCLDPDKPALGSRRVLAVGEKQFPEHIIRPAWCRRKEEA